MCYYIDRRKKKLTDLRAAKAACHIQEVVKMSIMEVINYEKFNSEYRTPEWMRAERYEFCDELYGDRAEKKNSLLQTMTALLLSVF